MEDHRVTERKRKTIIAINRRIREARAALAETVRSGVQSASLTSSGNASSYTRLDMAALRKEIASLERQKAALLRGSSRTVAPDFDLC